MSEEIVEIQEMQPQMPLIGEPAPEFTAVTTNGTINFPKDYKGKWVILFSHPADFTPVCTTEFMTFASIADELRDELNTELVGLSIDSLYAHLAWLRSIEDLKWKNLEDIKLRFPLIEDIKMEVASKYGMVQPGQSDTQAVRAVFFVDPKGNIRTIMYYPLEIGRNFDEIKRVLQALQKHDADKVALPADWRPGEPVIVPAPRTIEGVDERVEDKSMDCKDWYLCFKDSK